MKNALKKYKYLRLFESLTAKEQRRFAEYLRTFSAAKAVSLQIHDYYLSKKRRRAVDLHRDCAALFGVDNTSNYTKISNGLSDLFGLLRDFLVREESLHRPQVRDLLFMRILERKKADKLSEQYAKQMQKGFAKRDAPDLWQPFFQTRLLHDSYFRNGTKTPADAPLVEAGMESLRDFYRGVHLKYAVEMFNTERVTGRKSETFDPTETAKIIAATDADSPLLNRFYARLYSFLRAPAMPTVRSLQQIVRTETTLSATDRMIAVLHIANYLVAEVRRGNRAALSAALENFKFGLAQGLLVHEGEMDKTVYENVINAACATEEFAWAEAFCHDYKDRLRPDLRADTYRLARACIAYDSGKKQDVITMLKDFEAADLFQNLRVRSLRLFCLYHAAAEADIESECDNFRRFVKRNKMSDRNKTAALNFIALFKKAARPDADFAALKREAAAVETLFLRSRLLRFFEAR